MDPRTKDAIRSFPIVLKTLNERVTACEEVLEKI